MTSENTRKEPKEVFNDMAALRGIYEDIKRKPPVMFELESGLSGIAGHYKFPDEMTASEFEDAFFIRWDNWFCGAPRVFYDYYTPDSKLSVKDQLQQFKAAPEYTALALEAWTKLVELNPSLKKITINTQELGELLDALHGVASCFNPDDLSFFLKLKHEGKMPAATAMETPEIALYINFIEQRVETYMGWVASPETLQYIADQIIQRDEKEKTLYRRNHKELALMGYSQEDTKAIERFTAKFKKKSNTAARGAQGPQS